MTGNHRPARAAHVYFGRFPDGSVESASITVYADGTTSILRRDRTGERPEAVTPWTAAASPSPEEIGRLLLDTCHQVGGTLLVRFLSTVVHGLLPEDASPLLPTALFDDQVSLDEWVSFQATLADDVAAALVEAEALQWAQRIQQPGTKERSAFAGVVAGVGGRRLDWLLREAAAQRRGTGTRFGGVILDQLTVPARQGIEKILDEQEPPDEPYLRTIWRHLFLPGITIGFVFGMQLFGAATFAGPVIGPLFALANQRAVQAGTATSDYTAVGVVLTVWSVLLLIAAFARDRKPAPAGIRYARLCRAGSLVPVGAVFVAGSPSFGDPVPVWVPIALGVVMACIGLAATLAVLVDPDVKVPIRPSRRRTNPVEEHGTVTAVWPWPPPASGS